MMKKNEMISNVMDIINGTINAMHENIKPATTDKDSVLSALITEYKALSVQASTIGTAYSLRAGYILKQIKDDKLYTVRNYKGIGDFAKNELGVSPATATTAIKVVNMIEKNKALPAPMDFSNIPYKLLVEFSSDRYTWDQKEDAIAEYRSGLSANAIIDKLKMSRTLTDKELERKHEKEKEKAENEERAQRTTETINSALTESRTRVNDSRKDETARIIDEINSYRQYAIGVPSPEQYTRLYNELAVLMPTANKYDVHPFDIIVIEYLKLYDEQNTLSDLYTVAGLVNEIAKRAETETNTEE